MKSPFVNEIEPNKIITTSFLVQSKEIRQKKGGDPYLSLMLGDRTGELDAKMWDNVAEIIDDFERDDFVKVKGLVQVFHNRPQLTIHKMRRMDDSEVELADYFPSSKRDPEEMWTELRGIVAGIGNVHLRALLDALLDEPDVALRLRRAPAAKQIHHAFLGGLLEHVLSVCAMAKLAAGHYRSVDADLLLTGVVLHDIGKIYEFELRARHFVFDRRAVAGAHADCAAHGVGQAACDAGIPAAAADAGGAHDSEPPWTARIRVAEGAAVSRGAAAALSRRSDSKMESMRALIDNDRQVEGCFTSYNSALGRTALKKDRFLNGAAAPAVSARVVSAPPVDDPLEAPSASEAAAAPPAPKPPAHPVARPPFSSRNDSVFGDKLKQALLAPVQEQET